MNKETKTGYIYSLTCSNPNLVYYGSTTKKLNDRLTGHRYNFNHNISGSANILFECDGVKINMLEEIEFEDKQELRDRESYYIRNLKCVNKRIENRTKKEYSKDNKIKINKYYKEYYKQNKKDHNKKNKEYREKNKDKLKEYSKKYRDENQNIKRKNKIICPCGGKYSESRFTEHKKTQKHQVYEFLKEIEDSNIIV